MKSYYLYVCCNLSLVTVSAIKLVHVRNSGEKLVDLIQSRSQVVRCPKVSVFEELGMKLN